MDRDGAQQDDSCGGCGLCVPCPNGVDILANLELWRVMRTQGDRTPAMSEYARLRSASLANDVRGAHAGACFDCGECEARCPKRIRIIRRLEDVDAALGQGG